MFEKILAQLKTRYKNLGLSENILKVMAEALVKSVKEETEIETAVEGVEGQMKVYQSFADQNRTQAAELEKLKKATPAAAEPAATDPKPAATPEVVPEWAKGLIETNKLLLEKKEADEKAAASKVNSLKLVEKLKELKVSEAFYKLHIEGKEFADDQAIETFASTIAEAETSYKQANNIQVLENKAPTIFGSTSVEGEVSPAVQQFIKDKYKTNEAN